MDNTSENKPTKHMNIGILAHVDAGKTTLSESILYARGSIRKLGRVDHGDAFLDTDALERERGITIFSKQAQVKLGEKDVTLLDTPGHVDFSAEMERTLQVLDYAILVINGADGIQGHTKTLWRLLKRYRIPVFLFVNKMDQSQTDREKLMADLKSRLDESCVDFGEERKIWMENVAVCDEKLLEEYLEHEAVDDRAVAGLIAERKVFPCYFGSALKMLGVEEFLQGMERYTRCPGYPAEFGAKIYKIARDEQGSRLTYLKITGGSLKVKDVLTNRRTDSNTEDTEKIWEEKADQIRVYSGAKYEVVNEAEAGMICAVTGLSHTRPGEGLGIEKESELPVLSPVLNYQIQLPGQCDVHGMLLKLRQLEEEEPQLHIVWNEQLGEIHAQVMGEVQIEILKRLIQERYGVEVEFGTGSIVYKETIENPVEGAGHFEPLRHYAEVHLLMEPGEPGSGLVFASACSEEMLDRNWQRLILTHLEEKEHKGVLTGAPVTDMKITLTAGRAHLKHTEGGDFRQATYRAVRQGLMKGKSVLLEPYYEFQLEVPAENAGRAMSDIQRMYGEVNPPRMEEGMAVLAGKAPAASMGDYQREVTAYTKGHGRLFCTLKGYEPCHNAEEVIENAGYDPEGDLENPPGSVFCSHGAGYYVSWDEADEKMHVESGIDFREEEKKTQITGKKSAPVSSSWADDKELQEIFTRTYGEVKRVKSVPARQSVNFNTDESKRRGRQKEKPDEYLLVDGYNIIFAWDDLKELAKVNIEAARDKLMDVLSNYQGFKKCVLILVFDAYKVAGNPGAVMQYHNIHVIYTKEAETADQYIEKAVHNLARTYHVTVATSDALEQVIILGQGGHRMSAKGLWKEIQEVNKEIRNEYLNLPEKGRNYLFDYLPGELEEEMEKIRLGEKEGEQLT